VSAGAQKRGHLADPGPAGRGTGRPQDRRLAQGHARALPGHHRTPAVPHVDPRARRQLRERDGEHRAGRGGHHLGEVFVAHRPAVGRPEEALDHQGYRLVFTFRGSFDFEGSNHTFVLVFYVKKAFKLLETKNIDPR
jgi:hypothetical protein